MFAFKFHDSLHLTEKGDSGTIYCKRKYEYQLILWILWWLFIISKMKYIAGVRFTKVVILPSYSSLANVSVEFCESHLCYQMGWSLSGYELWRTRDINYVTADLA